MIQNIEKGGGFRGALNYTFEKVGAEPIGGNMAGRTPRELAAEFRAVRELRPDVETVVFHASLSAPIGESVTEAQWVAIADRYAERMGFGDSAYVVVRHQDTAHDHVHIVASRIDAYGRVVSDQWDRYKGQEVLRAIEREHQLTPVRSSWDPARETLARQLTKAEVQQFREDVAAARRPFVETVREHAGAAFRDARSWEDLERRLATEGFRVEPRRGGLVVTDGTEVVKASSVGRDCSRARLEQRFGVSYGEWTEQRAAERPEPPPLRPEREPLGEQLGERERPAGLTAARGADGAGGGRAADRARVGRAVADGAAPGGAGAGVARGDRAERGGGAAGNDPAHQPDRGLAPLRVDGRRIDDPAPAARGLPTPVGRDLGAERGERAGGGHDGGDVSSLRDAIQRDLERLTWRRDVEAAIAQASERAAYAERQLATLTTTHARAVREAEAGFARALDAVYRDPAAARAAIEGQARTAGWSATLRAVCEQPVVFGELQGHRLGRLALDGGARERALAAVPEVARTAGDHFTVQAAVWQGRHEAAELTGAVQAARDEARQLGVRLTGVPSERALLTQLAEHTHGLAPAALDELQRGLTLVQRQVLGQARALATEAIIGRGRDDGLGL